MISNFFYKFRSDYNKINLAEELKKEISSAFNVWNISHEYPILYA